MTRLASVLAIGVLASPGTPAWSCCEAASTFWDQARACSKVFVGHVVGHLPAETGRGMIVTVEQVLQGTVPESQLTLFAPLGISEVAPAPVGSRFVFVLVRFEDYDAYTIDAGECSEPALLPVDENHSVSWYRTELDRRATAARPSLEASCAAGKDTACYELGCMYQEGRGVRRDHRRAASLFRRAIELQWE